MNLLNDLQILVFLWYTLKRYFLTKFYLNLKIFFTYLVHIR